MTYAMRQQTAFGAFTSCEDHPSGAAWPSKTNDCIGYEVGCPDRTECCPADTWYNAVYAELRGQNSLRRQNEEKVRHAMALLVAPTPSGFATGLEQLAYDAGGNASPATVQRIVEAATMFDVVFPRERFKYDKAKEPAPKHPLPPLQCGGNDHMYSGYKLRAHWPAARIDAVQLLTGHTFTAAERNQLARAGLAADGAFSETAAKLMPPGLRPLLAPGPVAAKFAEIGSLVRSLRGCRPDEYRDTMPTGADLVGPGRRGTLALTPWLQSFVTALTPPTGLRLPELTGIVKPPNMRHPGLPPTEANEEGGPSRMPPSGGDGMSTGAKVALAGIGLALGYGLYRVVM